MKLCSKTQQIAPFKKLFSWKYSPNPPSNKPLRGMQPARTTKKLIPIANPAYAHGKI